MDKLIYERKKQNDSFMTALENRIQADVGCTKKEANIVANYILALFATAEELSDKDADEELNYGDNR